MNLGLRKQINSIFSKVRSRSIKAEVNSFDTPTPPEKKVRADHVSNEALLKAWRSKSKNGYQNHIQTSERLHENSIELVEFLEENVGEWLANFRSIHEVGCGSGRNLSYLFNRWPHLNLTGNDLDASAVFEASGEEGRKAFTLVEEDSLTFLRRCASSGKGYSAIMVSDHLMHLSRLIIDEVYQRISECADEYIFLREPYGKVTRLQKSFSEERFVWAADEFEEVFADFDLITWKSCHNQSKFAEFRLMIFRRRA